MTTNGITYRLNFHDGPDDGDVAIVTKETIDEYDAWFRAIFPDPNAPIMYVIWIKSQRDGWMHRYSGEEDIIYNDRSSQRNIVLTFDATLPHSVGDGPGDEWKTKP